MATITLKGNPCQTFGELPAVGSQAPGFVLVDSDLSDVSLETYAGQKKLLSIVPSLDTPTCALSTRKFNEQAVGLDNVVVLVVSADLPFAQGRFCQTEGLKNVVPLSTMRSESFAKDYGVEIMDGPLRGITCRAIVLIDENDRIAYTELVNEIADEPDYSKALKALQ